MHKNRIFFLLLIVWIGWGCSSKSGEKQAVIQGKFSVADSATQSQTFLPTEITIVHRDSAGATPDTLFHAVTDSSGAFSGRAHFKEKGQYPVYLTHNGNQLGRFGLILAPNDSVRIEGQFPDMASTLTISSREHNAMRKYQRLNSGFQRVSRFIQAGRLTGDSLQQELLKWSNLYMDLYENNKGTRAAELAVSESVRLLSGWKNELMMKRIRKVQQNDRLIELGLSYGKNYMAQSKGLDAALAYLDTLAKITDSKIPRMRIRMNRIQLLYDSARVREAQNHLEQFQTKYSDDSLATKWAKSISYDLNYLSPGDTIPSFSFTQNGQIISRDSLKGTPYILEITRLTNKLYQEQFDRTVVIHSIYKNFGLEVVTLPLDESQITVDAFFEERVKPWPVADAKTFDRKELLDRFNVRLIPTRFLVDRNGKIVRKYVGREFQDVIKDIQTIVNNDQN